MREISKRLDGKGCDIVESKDSAYFLFVTHDKDFASLCNLMVSTQGTVDIPFKCKSLSNSGRCYSITNWEVFAVETMKELYTNNDVYVIRVYGSEYTNDEKSYEDGVVLPISSFDDGELVNLENEGYSVEVVSYNPIKVRLYNPPTCRNCEGFVHSKHDLHNGACEKHKFKEVTADMKSCFDFVDKDAYKLCKYYRGYGDYENEFCCNKFRTGRLCSMQSTCINFEEKDEEKVKCDDCEHCTGINPICKLTNNKVERFKLTSCVDFTPASTCDDCQYYCKDQNFEDFGSCRKHEYRSASGSMKRCTDFVWKNAYKNCIWRGENDTCAINHRPDDKCVKFTTCPKYAST
jgi:hypothetical protein